MKSLVLYGREELKNIGRADNLIRLGLLIIAIVVGTYKYSLYATTVTIFIFFSAISMLTIVFSGRKIFSLNFLRKDNSIEQGRFYYYLVSIIIILSGLLYFQSRTVYILTAGLTIILCFAAGVSMLSTKFKKK